MKRESSRVRHGRQLLAAVLTIAMLVTFMPGMAFANDEAAAKTKSGVSAKEDSKSAAYYQSEIDKLQTAFDGLSASVRNGDTGKDVSALIDKLNSAATALATAQAEAPRLKAEAAKYEEGTVEKSTSRQIVDSLSLPDGSGWAKVKYLITFIVSGGGSAWNEAIGPTIGPFVSDEIVAIGASKFEAEAAATAAAREDAEKKTVGIQQSVYYDAKEKNATDVFYQAYYGSSYINSRQAARDAVSANNNLSNETITSIASDIAALTALVIVAQSEENLKGSITDGENDINDAKDAIDNAESIAKDAETKDLTDAQKKALEDLLAAIKRVKDAQKALQDALEKAKNAKTPEEILAAQKEVDAARKELEDALSALVRIELIYDTTIKNGGGNSPGTTPGGINPPKQETSGAASTKTTPSVAKIRTPIKTIYLTKNKSYTIPYVLDAADGKLTTDSKLKVTSSKAKIVRLVNSGSTHKIKALKVGKTVITIKAQNGKKVKIKVIVQKKKVALKKFTVKTPKTLKVGKKYQLKITKLTKKATNISRVTFKSSSKKIATVDKAGKITALKKGTVEITIIVGKKKLVKTIIIK